MNCRGKTCRSGTRSVSEASDRHDRTLIFQATPAVVRVVHNPLKPRRRGRDGDYSPPQDPGERSYRTELSPRVMTSNRQSG